MRCLVTGASGFVGSHLVRELVSRRHSVTVLLRPESNVCRIQDCLDRVSIVRGSVDDLSALRESLEDGAVDAALHLAWDGVVVDERTSAGKALQNVRMSLQLWEILQQTRCAVLIVVGSQAEYGRHCGALQEDAPTYPLTSYGASKLATGILLNQLSKDAGMRFAWLRLFSAYGPADDERHMIPLLIRSLLRGERPALTAGDQIWDYLYVQDAVDALCAVLESNASGVFNLGSGAPCRLREFIEEVRNCVDPSLSLGFGEIPYRHDQVMHLEADIDRLKRATGWSPATSLRDGIRQTVKWYKQQYNYDNAAASS